MEPLIERLQSLTMYDPPSQPYPDFFWALAKVLECKKDWYRRKLNGEASAGLASEITEESLLKDIYEPAELKGQEQDLPAVFDHLDSFQGLGFAWDDCFCGDLGFSTLSGFDLMDLPDVGA